MFPFSTDPSNNGLIAGACVAGGLIAVALAAIVIVIVVIMCELKMETRSECSHQFVCLLYGEQRGYIMLNREKELAFLYLAGDKPNAQCFISLRA